MTLEELNEKKEELRKRLNIEKSSKRLENYFNVVNDELKTFARISRD